MQFVSRSRLLVLPIVLLACNKEAPATAGGPRAPERSPAIAAVSPAQAEAAEGKGSALEGAVPAAATASGEGFELTFSPKGTYSVGKPGEAEIVLVARAPFHVNEKYPYKFKLKDSAGLKFASPVVGKDRVKLEEKRATLSVPFTVETPGQHTVAGLFLFSVCAEDKCLIERKELALDIVAK